MHTGHYLLVKKSSADVARIFVSKTIISFIIKQIILIVGTLSTSVLIFNNH